MSSYESISRLVRFLPASNNGEPTPLIGEPIDKDIDVGVSHFNGDQIEVEVYNGTSILSPGLKTGRRAIIGRILSPLAASEVGTIRCIGLNYTSHAKECNLAIPEVPVLFTKPSTSLNHPHPSPVIIPSVFADGADYEAEVAIIIGKEAKDVPEDKALEYVAGFTGCHDVSSRALQFAQSQWAFSKSFDGSCPLGPVFVPLSSVPDLEKVKISGHLNGKQVQRSDLSDLIFSVQKIIAYISQGSTLPAGTVIITGTPGGIGWTANPRVILSHGDEFRVEVSHGVGTLINKTVVNNRQARL